MDMVKTVDSQIAEIEKDKTLYAEKKITELSDWIEILPDRKVTYKGNITMKEYLLSLKAAIEADPIKFADTEIQKLEQCKTVLIPIEEPIEELIKLERK